ncbi:MAG: hypothetical protein J4F36_10995 [Nitrosopumilaceae archaeon]|nr:hypothetical protein [Nitrosopumilaceae archaeon]
MKTRLLITIGIVAITSMFAGFLLFFHDVRQNTCEQMGGTWSVDHCLVTQEMFDSNQLTCDPGPVSEDETCGSNGITLVIEPATESEIDTRHIGHSPAFGYDSVQVNGTNAFLICSVLKIPCPENPVFDAIYRNDHNYTYFYYELHGMEYLFKIEEDGRLCYSHDGGHLEYEEQFECPAMPNEKKNDIMLDVKNILAQNQIDYNPDTLVVSHAPSIRGDPGCGAVADLNSAAHWFYIDSMSEPKNITLFSENPNQCRVNTSSCFCNVQIGLDALTLDEMYYFSAEDEEKFAGILIGYMHDENINRTPKFMIGNLNVNYTDPSAVGYCGKIWGTNTRGFFSGQIVDDQVASYIIDKELPLMCAISDDAKWWENEN